MSLQQIILNHIETGAQSGVYFNPAMMTHVSHFVTSVEDNGKTIERIIIQVHTIGGGSFKFECDSIAAGLAKVGISMNNLTTKL